MVAKPLTELLRFMTLASVFMAGPAISDVGHAQSNADNRSVRPPITRTVRVEARDAMRYSPDSLRVAVGDTIRFVVTNAGAIPHEFSLGTPEDLRRHARMMMTKKHEDTEGGGSGSMDLMPGETKELVWTFSSSKPTQIACLYPGHYQAGMLMTVEIDQA